ncbi:nucleotidyltransferase [Acidobacteria bacterium ACD]|nr:MAG: nucleotidyltransferase [Acidobacteriota bacterium]MCE7956528.1 nucleotidyltransferase [Acidobacteria bacterium ACB2]MDL1948822.1 nucleotidyltransferase [Acidobacteria bacterium ACD]
MAGDQPSPLDTASAQVLRELAVRYGVRDIRVFGSRSRGDARPDSDLDLLVRVDYERGVGRRLVRFCLEASRLLGLRVDVVTERSLDPTLHARILREARALP